MDRSNIIGFALIFALTLGYFYINAPSSEEMAEETTETVDTTVSNSSEVKDIQEAPASSDTPQPTAMPAGDSTAMQGLLRAKYGLFAPAAQGEEGISTIENDVVQIRFSSKGGRIKDILLKKYKKLLDDSAHNHVEYPLYLHHHPNNKWEYFIPYKEAAAGFINTSDLYFSPSIDGQKISFTATGEKEVRFVQSYTLGQGYDLKYEVTLDGHNLLLPAGEQSIQFHWENYLEKVEQNTTVEKQYTTLYYKPKEDSPTYVGDNDKESIAEPIEWVSSTNQFFNTSLLSDPDHPFAEGLLETQTFEDNDEHIKIHKVNLKIPVQNNAFHSSMNIYSGPNVFKSLRTYNRELEDIIPFGWGIFGTVNRWIIRPLFDFLASWIGSFGWAIVLLTLMVKLALSPLNYKMIYSQSKMSALKPVVAKLKEKYKDDAQTLQMETMKIYREYGVNPLGGCLPMLLQLPIWIALYRFFPASIDFRQQPFLWAHDLSSYDVLTYLPFEIPFVGGHISLFTVLWVVTTLIYTYYNSKMMDMSMGNPSMKYMQYFMPVMFLGFFNNYASGLTAYLFTSNLFNIGQTLLIKNVLIDHEKIKEQLRRNKEKPKKKKGFAAKFEQAMKEQQRQAEARKKKK